MGRGEGIRGPGFEGRTQVEELRSRVVRRRARHPARRHASCRLRPWAFAVIFAAGALTFPFTQLIVDWVRRVFHFYTQQLNSLAACPKMNDSHVRTRIHELINETRRFDLWIISMAGISMSLAASILLYATWSRDFPTAIAAALMVTMSVCSLISSIQRYRRQQAQLRRINDAEAAYRHIGIGFQKLVSIIEHGEHPDKIGIYGLEPILEESSQTALLLPKMSWLTGAGSIFSFGGNYYVHDDALLDEQWEETAIESDLRFARVVTKESNTWFDGDVKKALNATWIMAEATGVHI
jgi:hypothetical protein